LKQKQNHVQELNANIFKLKSQKKRKKLK